MQDCGHPVGYPISLPWQFQSFPKQSKQHGTFSSGKSCWTSNNIDNPHPCYTSKFLRGAGTGHSLQRALSITAGARFATPELAEGGGYGPFLVLTALMVREPPKRTPVSVTDVRGFQRPVMHARGRLQENSPITGRCGNAGAETRRKTAESFHSPNRFIYIVRR